MNVQELETIVALQNTKKGAFVALKNYVNSSNEVANVVINAKISYEQAKKKDIKKLSNFNPFAIELEGAILVSGFTRDELTEAANELKTSLIKPCAVRSNGQKNAYTQLGNGLKVHNDTLDMSVWGLVASKKVLIAGNYPTVNSSKKTLAKNWVKKQLNLSTSKFRNYKLDNLTTLCTNGITVSKKEAKKLPKQIRVVIETMTTIKILTT
jgi:hypothetical protein